MRRLPFFFVALFACADLQAKWIWSSDTGFVDTSTYETGDPEVLYRKADAMYNAGQFKDAGDEFNRIALYVGDAHWQEQALFMSGEAYYKAGKYYKAYEAYDSYLTQYARSERLKYVVKQLADCGFKLMGGAKKEILGVGILSGEGTGVECVKKVIEKYPYEENVDQYEYLLINHYLAEREFDQAGIEADLFLTTYPNSQWAPSVQFLKGQAQLSQNQGVPYDGQSLANARKTFEEYLSKNPNGDKTDDVKQRLAEIDAKEAEKDFEVADWYRRTGHKDSAKLYCEIVIRKHPQTKWAEKAKQMLAEMK